MTKRTQTASEEKVNAITHFIGIIFCLIAMPVLLYKSYNPEDIRAFISVLTFALGILLVYIFSTLYHNCKEESVKKTLNKFDHISIFFLIAGTYTPLIYRYLSATGSLIFLSIMWGLVLMGIFIKIFFLNRSPWFSITLYMLMGWMILFVLKPMLLNMPYEVLLWILLGGVFYSTGVYFYMKKNKLYFHTIWHILVFLGTTSHYIAIYLSFTL